MREERETRDIDERQKRSMKDGAHVHVDIIFDIDGWFAAGLEWIPDPIYPSRFEHYIYT